MTIVPICGWARAPSRCTGSLARSVRLLQLPPDWQSELVQMMGEGDEVATLANRRGRLAAQRRRLKEAWVRGDFEEDEDVYRRELERLRRELEQLPSEEDLVQVQQAAALLDSLSEVWDGAEVGDQRDLTQLMLREVRVDVGQGRLLVLYPTRAVPAAVPQDSLIG